MKYIKVIIGSNFGDEGKGLMTDYMCDLNANSVVIRYNSSAQAGHTVVLPNGIRHVFGHFSSGTLQGSPTFLSSYFSINPLLFLKEYDELNKKDITPYTIVDLNCPIVIPQDMIINQIIERHRGNNRHGSCGLGYNESIIRNSMGEFKITIDDVINKSYKEKLNHIKGEYIPKRFKDLKLEDCSDELINRLYDDNIASHFIYDIENEFIPKVKVSNMEAVSNNYETLIFEGAQGLMLSEDYKYFPHVTHSKTGISNVVNLLKNMGRHKLDIEVIYITRGYLTRHGAGPLPHEINKKPYENIVDLTNIPNEFQGELRFAPLDIDMLEENIRNDYMKIQSKKQFLNIKKSIAITCLDQLGDDRAVYYKNNEKIENISKEFIDDICFKINPYSCYLSYGPTRDTILKYKK